MPEEDAYFKKSSSDNFLAFRTRNQLQISVAQIMNQCLNSKDFNSFRQKLETIADSEHNIDGGTFCATMAGVTTTINDKKLEELNRSIEQYHRGSKVFNYKPLMEEYQQQADFKLNSQLWMVYYQFYDEAADLLDTSHLAEVSIQIISILITLSRTIDTYNLIFRLANSFLQNSKTQRPLKFLPNFQIS